MSHSATEITCNECKTKFQGVLNNIFNIEKEYAALCPICKKQTSIKGIAAIIDADITINAVEIWCVTDLIHEFHKIERTINDKFPRLNATHFVNNLFMKIEDYGDYYSFDGANYGISDDGIMYALEDAQYLQWSAIPTQEEIDEFREFWEIIITECIEDLEGIEWAINEAPELIKAERERRAKFITSVPLSRIENPIDYNMKARKLIDKMDKEELLNHFKLDSSLLSVFELREELKMIKKGCGLEFCKEIENISNAQKAKTSYSNDALDRPNIVNKSHTTKVVGVTFDNENGINRQKILTQLCSGSNIELVNDIDNPYDKYAIKVVSEFGCIGHLSREEAFRFSQKHISLGECFVTSLKRVDNGKVGCLINFNYQESEVKSKKNNRSNSCSSSLSNDDYSGGGGDNNDDDYEAPTIDSPPEEFYDYFAEEMYAVVRDGSPY